MSIRPNALGGWAGLMGSLSKILYVKTRDGIALAVSQANGCDDCLAAHSYVSANLAKPLRGEIALNRQGRSGNPKLRWRSRRPFHRGARRGVRRPVRGGQRRRVDAHLEMIALTAQFLLTNLMNNALQTPIDFPEVSPAKAA